MSANGYPFITRKQILDRIAAEPAFAAECIAIIQDRHERRTIHGEDSMGWMASHAAKATKLAAKLASGDASEKDRVEAMQLVKSYSKQLARVLRERELASRPDLHAQAAVFGVGVAEQSEVPLEAAPSSPPMEISEQIPTKKRGRPKGSKNKPKMEDPRRRRPRT